MQRPSIRRLLVLIAGIGVAFFLWYAVSNRNAFLHASEIRRAVGPGISRQSLQTIVASHGGTVRERDAGRATVRTYGDGIICKFEVQLTNGLVNRVGEPTCID